MPSFWEGRTAAWLVGIGLFGLVMGPLLFTLLNAGEEEAWRWDVVLDCLATRAYEVPCEHCGQISSVPVASKANAICQPCNRGTPVPENASTTWVAGQLTVGLWITVKISLFSLALGLPLGLIGGLSRLSKNTGLRAFAAAYVEVVRNTPLLVQIFVAYYMVGKIIDSFVDPALWQDSRPFVLGGMALAVFAGAYITEIVRAGILSVDPGQTEAARALGMSHFQTMVHIILPQAFRKILPPLAGQCISLVKDSSLCSVISVVELSKAGRNVVSANFRAFEVWFTVAFLYFAMILPLSLLVRRLEKGHSQA